jgi:prephenate dehydrogenase
MDNTLAPLVVGYKGEIGSFILQELLKCYPKATNIYCFDINENYTERIRRIKKSDIIFLCIPLEQTVDWLIKFEPYLRDKIIFEQTSLKGVLFKDKCFKKIQHLNIKSMHILFKPSMTAKADWSIAFIKPKDRFLVNDAIYWYEYTTMFDIPEKNFVYYEGWEDHDKDMAIQQALLHKVLLLVDKLNETCHKKRVTYLSKKVHELVLRIKCGNKNMYELIQKNPKLRKLNATFLENFKNFKIQDFI